MKKAGIAPATEAGLPTTAGSLQVLPIQTWNTTPIDLRIRLSNAWQQEKPWLLSKNIAAICVIFHIFILCRYLAQEVYYCYKS